MNNPEGWELILESLPVREKIQRKQQCNSPNAHHDQLESTSFKSSN